MHCARVCAGREDREEYTAASARKKRKAGGLSNREKEHKKALPLAARLSQARARMISRKRGAKAKSTQFKGRKAWKT